MTRKHVRVADEHVERILRGEMAVIPRLEFERELHAGDDIDLITEDGDAFATAQIDWVGEMDATRFVRDEWDQLREYASIGELFDELRAYHPDADLAPGIRLDVVALDDIDEGAGGRGQLTPMVPDGGTRLAENFDEFAKPDQPCQSCQDLVRPKYLEDGLCPGCRYTEGA